MPANLHHVPYCFADAYWCLRKDMITQAEYIKRLVAHFGGVRHVDPDPVDENDSGICPRFVPDRFASAVRQVTVVKNLENLRAKKPEADPMQPLAVLAAEHGHCKILEYCLDKGAIIDRNLGDGMMKGGRKDPGVEKLVEQHSVRIEEVLETRLDENGDIADSEMAEFDVIEW